MLCLAILESAILAIDGSKLKEPHQVGHSVHVKDEDDEKYVFQLKLNHSKCCWIAGSNVLFGLVLKCIGI